MLTPNDIHYLVGVLSRAAAPDNVEVELGSKVYDRAGRKKRDVDVTITARMPDGSITAICGIEVKKHSRRLTIENVEQLWAKLRDMPAVTSRAIVSANGFTSGAIAKARAHKVELWELVDWDRASTKFEKLGIAPEFKMTEISYAWVGEPHVEFRLQGKAPDAFRTTPQQPILASNGLPIDNCPDIDSLAKLIVSRMPSEVGQKHLLEAPPEAQCPVDFSINVPEDPKILVQNERFSITPARVTGVIRKYMRPISEYLKVLRRHADKQLIGDCLVYEDWEGALMGLVVTNKEQNVTLVRIPISERNKKKLIKVKLKDAGSFK